MSSSDFCTYIKTQLCIHYTHVTCTYLSPQTKQKAIENDIQHELWPQHTCTPHVRIYAHTCTGTLNGYTQKVAVIYGKVYFKTMWEDIILKDDHKSHRPLTTDLLTSLTVYF